MADRAPDRKNPLLTAGLVAVAALGAIALASRRQGLFGRLADGTAPFGAVAGRAALGALGGIAVAFGIIWLLRLTNPRHRLIEDAPSHPRWRQVLLWSIPVVLLLAVLGAAAGSATTPLRPRTPSADEGQQSQGEPGGASYIDANGDGKPDLDENGQPKLVFDSNGDGTYDSVLKPCEPNSSVYTGASRAVHAAASAPTIQIPIDDECDGTVDRWVPLRRSPVTGRGPTTGEAGRAPSAPSRSPDVGGALRTLLILIAIAAVIGAIYAIIAMILRRGERADDGDGVIPAPTDETGDAVDREAAALTLDDSIAAMLAGSDPRAAVLAAYATLLDGLAAAGLPRQTYEAPVEHLTRCLRTLEVRAEPLQDLVDVFTMARFSDHPVTEAHRAEAVGALRAAQADLAGALAGSGAV